MDEWLGKGIEVFRYGGGCGKNLKSGRMMFGGCGKGVEGFRRISRCVE